MRRLQKIFLLVAMGKHICRAYVHVDEHRCTCEELVHLCNAMNQVHGIPMDVPLVDEH
jgi:hypothetical protein